MNLQEAFPQYKIGRGSYASRKPTIEPWKSKSVLQIGAFCSFSSGITIYLGGEHRTDWVTTFPFQHMYGYASQIQGHPKSKGDVIIGNDVWIGTGAMILSGVTIGDGSVIGALSVVARDIGPYEIHAGNPAKRIRYRFPYGMRQDLLKIKWWDWPDEKIKRFIPLMLNTNARRFINTIKGDEDGD